MSLNRKLVNEGPQRAQKEPQPMINLARKIHRSRTGVLKERNPWQALSKDTF